MKKSQLVQLVLALLFGPFGLFYSSVAAGIAMAIAGVVLLILHPVFLLVWVAVCWPLSVLIGVYAVYRNNARVSLQDRRHEQLLRSLKDRQPGAG